MRSRPTSATPARTTDAILDLRLLKIPTFFAGVIGGLIFRVGIGAMPFLLPLLLQIGFGLTPFESGSLTFATAAGALLMKFTATTLLRRFGFRRTLVVNGLISGAFLAACALFTPTTPHWMLLLTLLTGGFFRSLEFTALNAISYADIDPPRMSRATSFASVSQQMSGAIGVAAAAIAVETIQSGFGDPTLQARDLSLAFVMVAIISSLSVFVFATGSSRTQARLFRQASGAAGSSARGGGIDRGREPLSPARFFLRPRRSRESDRIRGNEGRDRHMRPGEAVEVQHHRLRILNLGPGHGQRPRGR